MSEEAPVGVGGTLGCPAASGVRLCGAAPCFSVSVAFRRVRVKPHRCSFTRAAARQLAALAWKLAYVLVNVLLGAETRHSCFTLLLYK